MYPDFKAKHLTKLTFAPEPKSKRRRPPFWGEDIFDYIYDRDYDFWDFVEKASKPIPPAPVIQYVLTKPSSQLTLRIPQVNL